MTNKRINTAIYDDDADWIEASRYASRTPEGYVECSSQEATAIGWFGRALPFDRYRSGTPLSGCISVIVGLGTDRSVMVRACDMDVWGMQFVKQEEAKPAEPTSGVIDLMEALKQSLLHKKAKKEGDE
jgi:hypothetical protein